MSTPSARRYDAIVVGGGHNGLVCAAYLARGGLRTLVVERSRDLGGACATRELAPGVRTPLAAHTVGRFSGVIARDLGLRAHGLRLVQPAVRAWAPQLDGPPLTLWGDVARTAAELAPRSPADARAYPEFDRFVRALSALLSRVMGRTPPDLRRPTVADALGGLELGLGYRGLSAPDTRAFLRVLPMPIGDLLGERFESDALRALLAVRGLLYSSLGPRSAGTTQLLLADSAGNDGGAAGQAVVARGGPGALADALAAAVRGYGGDIRTGSEVTGVTSRDGRATGVVLAGGEAIDAGVVVSGIDPRQTLLRLVDPVELGPTLRWRAGNIRARGVTAKVDLALAELPRFRGLDGADAETRLRGRIVIAPSMDVLERAQGAVKYGQVSERPFLEATIPTLIDPSLVDADASGGVRHVMSVVVQAVPHRGAAGEGDGPSAVPGSLADLVLRTLEPYAPGIDRLVVARRETTPDDLERELGVTGGHPFHAEPGLDQWYAWRPLLGHARYRMPLDGLYLCGAGAHPGGGVTGRPGRNAAREVLRDRRARR